MKKMLAVMLAAAASMSVGVTAFADDMNVVLDSNAPSSSDTETPEVPQGEPSAFVFGADEDGVILGEDVLEPGKEYKFPVSMTYGDKSYALTDEMLENYKFTYSKVTTKGMKRFEIEEHKGTYYLYVRANETTAVEPIDIKYNVKLVNKEDNLTVFSQEVKFQYGYDEANSDYISDLSKGDIVEIDNNYPVITTSQFDKIAEINEYKNVTLAGSGWEFTVNVTDEKTKNMVFSNAGVKEVMAAFPDQDFKFFKFAGKPTFAATGRLALDVDDLVDEFDQMYTYRYADGKLYRINATFNSDENTLEFRTNKLDTFLVTNKLIKDGTVVDTDADVDSEESDENSNSSNSDKNNPSTGSGNLINEIVLAAISALR